MNSADISSTDVSGQSKIRLKTSATLFLGDCFVVALCMVFAYILRYTLGLGVSDISAYRPSLVPYILHYSAGFVLFLILAQNQDLYDLSVRSSFESTVYRVLKISMFWAVMFLGASLILKLEPSISRLFVGYTCIFMCTLLPLWRYGYLSAAKRLGFDTTVARRIAIIGHGPDMGGLVQRLTAKSADANEVVGLITLSDDAYTDEAGLQHLGNMHNLDLGSILENWNIDAVALAESNLPKDEVISIAKVCERRFVDFNLAPSHFEVFTSCLTLKKIGNQSVMGVAELPQNRVFNQLAKRAIDIVGALVGLSISIPVIAVMSALIKREDKGPAFFLQERVGQNGRIFRMIKLRSMKIGSESLDNDSQSTLRDDPRLLKWGAFIRKWNLDELPQFLNVLRGEMSLVGPRPERSYHVGLLLDEIPYYQSRHTVKPGMTGWAQVHGLRGDTSLEERIRHDLQYIENWSLWLDFVIQFRTLFNYKNAY